MIELEISRRYSLVLSFLILHIRFSLSKP